MKNIINWTFGGFFRALGRVLCFIVIGLIIGLIVAKSGLRVPTWLQPLYIVSADSVSYNYSQYRVQYYELGTGTTVWNSWQNFGSSSPLSSGYGVSTVATRFGFSSKFSSNTTYRFEVETGFSPAETINETFLNVNNTSCYGSSTSSWSNDASLIDCSFVGAIKVSGVNHVKYIFDVTPISNIYGVQFNIGFSGTSEVRSVNVYAKSTISTGPDIGGAIDNQTIVIQEEFDNITNIINQTNEDLINAITENDKVCKTTSYNKSYVGTSGVYLNSTGGTPSSSTSSVSDWISINSESIITQSYHIASNRYACFYNENKIVISCVAISSDRDNTTYTIPTGAFYFRFTISNGLSREIFNITTCTSGNQGVSDSINGLNNTLNDTDTEEDSSGLADWFNNFTVSIEGPLSSIVLLPINLLETLVVDYNESSTHPGLCASLNGQEFCVPSGDLIWKRSGCHDNSWFGCPDYQSFKSFFQLVAGGLIIFNLLRRIVKTIDKALDPTDSEVKVVDL